MAGKIVPLFPWTGLQQKLQPASRAKTALAFRVAAYLKSAHGHEILVGGHLL